MSGRGMSRSAPGIIHQDDDGWKIFSKPPPVAGSWGLQLREKTQTLVSYYGLLPTEPNVQNRQTDFIV